MRGLHLIKHYSRTQKVVTLSSAEAELGGVVHGASEVRALLSVQGPRPQPQREEPEQHLLSGAPGSSQPPVPAEVDSVATASSTPAGPVAPEPREKPQQFQQDQSGRSFVTLSGRRLQQHLFSEAPGSAP